MKMKLSDIKKMLDAGTKPVVEFTSGVDEFEGYAEASMRCRITGIVDDFDCVKVSFDFSEFETLNVQCESPTYYDKNGRPTLTASQAGHYKAQDYAYVDPNQDFPAVLVSGLVSQYLASGFDGSYVAWLESIVSKSNS
jgi:hypothetical protein